MKIALTGSFSCGKTTFVKNYETDLIKGINLERNSKDQENIFFNQLRFELNNKNFITDNCLITVLAYTKELLPKEYNFQLSYTEKHLKNHPYDKVILMPILEIEDDGKRFTDKELQLKIYNNIIDIAKILKINLIYM